MSRPTIGQRLDRIEELLRFVLETPREVQRQTIWPARPTPKALGVRMKLWHESGEKGPAPAQLIAECGSCGTIYAGNVVGLHVVCMCETPARNLCETFLRSLRNAP